MNDQEYQCHPRQVFLSGPISFQQNKRESLHAALISVHKKDKPVYLLWTFAVQIWRWRRKSFQGHEVKIVYRAPTNTLVNGLT